MVDKKYTIEFTATEADRLVNDEGYATLQEKIGSLKSERLADREADELQLPWHAKKLIGGAPMMAVFHREGGLPDSLRAAKLMSAAPELLKAVKAVKASQSRGCLIVGSVAWDEEIQPLVDRALRKVETGVPDEG